MVNQTPAFCWSLIRWCLAPDLQGPGNYLLIFPEPLFDTLKSPKYDSNLVPTIFIGFFGLCESCTGLPYWAYFFMYRLPSRRKLENVIFQAPTMQGAFFRDRPNVAVWPLWDSNSRKVKVFSKIQLLQCPDGPTMRRAFCTDRPNDALWPLWDSISWKCKVFSKVQLLQCPSGPNMQRAIFKHYPNGAIWPLWESISRKLKMCSNV